jgi:1-phosphofructokinase
VSGPTVGVFDPSLFVTVAVETGDEIHFHAGGQGLWVARMVAVLGGRPTLCTALGDESGDVLRALLDRESLDLRTPDSASRNGAYVDDRRGGERERVAEDAPGPFGRHEVDDLFGAALVTGLDAGTMVLAGPQPPDLVKPDVYRRLTHDLRAGGATVVVDLSGEHLLAAIDGGADVVKVDERELVEAGFVDEDPGEDAVLTALGEIGGSLVVVSRGSEPTLARHEDTYLSCQAPRFDAIDKAGSGDSLTATIATGLARGEDVVEVLRLGMAAGALNVTRRGLGTGTRDEIRELAAHVEVRTVEGGRSTARATG